MFLGGLSQGLGLGFGVCVLSQDEGSRDFRRGDDGLGLRMIILTFYRRFRTESLGLSMFCVPRIRTLYCRALDWGLSFCVDCFQDKPYEAMLNTENAFINQQACRGFGFPKGCGNEC